MIGAYLPGDSTVELREVAQPRPGHGQIVLRVHASTICGSDLRAIYRQHLGEGAERYRMVVAGHEPAGEVVEVGPGCRRLRVGDRVAVYHITGCEQCDDCRRGYPISCSSPRRAAYGWQRDGGHAELMLIEEVSAIVLPDALSFVDGACVACGFGTAYEALRRAGLSGADRLLITGLGPVGMAVGLLAGRLGSPLRIGVESNPRRAQLARELGAVDVCLDAGPEAVEQVRSLTAGHGCEVSVDASGATAARATALTATRRWGRAVLVGEGGDLAVATSPVLIHQQLTVLGSWVTSTWRLAELVDLLALWALHPEQVVTDRFALRDAGQAYALADRADCGKVAVLPTQS